MGTEPTTPRRALWRRRAVQAFAALFALVLIVRLVWGWWIDRQLAAQLDEIRSRGEPVAVSDVVYPFVPDSENAFLMQMQAVSALANPNSPRSSTLEYAGYPPYSPAWLTLAAASEKANAQAFALARQARQLSKVQLRQTLSSQARNRILGNLNSAKLLANTLADGAAHAHVSGNDAEAIERLLDTLHLARSLRHDDFVVSQLVAMGIEAIACHEAMAIGPGLRSDPATRESLRRLIATLLDEQEISVNLRRSLMLERLMWIDQAQSSIGGMWVVRPLAQHQIIRHGRNLGLNIEATGCATWPQAQPMLARSTDPRLDPYPQFFHRGSWDAFFERHFRLLAERRTTAAALACQLYRLDHGRFPHQLTDLVPGYLSAVPKDPFRADDRPLGYAVLKGKLPTGGDRPVLWFDAGPHDMAPGNEPAYGWTVHRTPTSILSIRQYRDLTRFLPQGPDDQPQEPNAPDQEPR